VEITQSHGGGGKQARSVLEGNEGGYVGYVKRIAGHPSKNIGIL